MGIHLFQGDIVPGSSPGSSLVLNRMSDSALSDGMTDSSIPRLWSECLKVDLGVT